MTTYNVLTMPEAEARIVEAFAFIADHSPDNAETWLHGISKAIASLDTFPHRCTVAREQEFLHGRHLRQLIYRSHRIIFDVDEAIMTVRVLYVRHGAERAVGEPTGDADET